jgi:hypothetical protein
VVSTSRKEKQMSESKPVRPSGNPAPELPNGTETLSREQRDFAEALGHALAEKWLQAHSQVEQEVDDARAID